MPPHLTAPIANDIAPVTTREAFALSVRQALDNNPMSIAFDEMADCALRHDDAGYAAAKRIFHKLRDAAR
jgi:hypothetical protein